MSISFLKLDTNPITPPPRGFNGGGGSYSTTVPRRIAFLHHHNWKNASISCSASSTVVEEHITDSPSRIESLSQVSAVLGCQWGDEGKGKLVDILAKHFDVVARCQLGH